MRKYSYYIISSLLLSATVFVGGCAFNHRPSGIISPVPIDGTSTSTEATLSTTSTAYILASGYKVDKQTKLKHEWVSIYRTNGDFVKKVDDQVGGFIFGQHIYRQMNSRLSADAASSTDVSVIVSFSPMTETSTTLEFTKTNNTNPYNAINPIIAFTVSSDEKYIAWQNTSGEIYFSKMDGSDLKLVSVNDGRYSWRLSFSENGSELFFYGKDGQCSWSIQDQVVVRIEDQISSKSDIQQLVSSSGRYSAKVRDTNELESENVIIITDMNENKTVEVPFSVEELVPPSDTFPTSYGPYIVGFSSDEKKLLFGFGSAWYQWAGTYRVDIDGENLEILLKDAEPLAYLSNSTILVSRISEGLQIVTTAGEVLKSFPDAERFMGLMVVKE